MRSSFSSDVYPDNGERVEIRKCKVLGCGRKHNAKGYCETHYRRSQNKINKPIDAPIAKTGSEGVCSLSIDDAKVLLRRISNGDSIPKAAAFFGLSKTVVYHKRANCPAFDMACELAKFSAKLRVLREDQNPELRGQSEALRTQLHVVMENCMRDWYRGDFRW